MNLGWTRILPPHHPTLPKPLNLGWNNILKLGLKETQVSDLLGVAVGTEQSGQTSNTPCCALH